MLSALEVRHHHSYVDILSDIEADTQSNISQSMHMHELDQVAYEVAM